MSLQSVVINVKLNKIFLFDLFFKKKTFNSSAMLLDKKMFIV